MDKCSDFLSLLVSRGMLSEEESSQLGLQYGLDQFALINHLIKKSGYSREEMGKLWGDTIGYSHVPLETTLFEPQVIQKIPEEFARKNNIILIYQIEDTITAAVSNPIDIFLIEKVESITKCKISPIFSFPEEIQAAIQIEYITSDSIKTLSAQTASREIIREGVNITQEELKAIAGDQSVIKLTNDVILLAIKEHASDIHIEPDENCVKVRFRIDGMLQEKLTLETTLLAPLVSRLKIMANLNITEKRRPQDGHITADLPNKSIDFRFSSIPTIYGEKIVLRILGQSMSKKVPQLEEIDLSKSVYSNTKRIIKSPNGIFFVTGPTGSGKTTTLFSVLQHLNKPDVNIMTIEDPVEYRLSGINQIQINHHIGLDFAAALRSFLRQDPDVILVGEIRDVETAKIAAQAALTGHLVLATMHTNNSLQAVTRLIEIGVEPFLVAPSIIGVMAQRLVRRICKHCIEKYALTHEEINSLFACIDEDEVYFYRGKGCINCNCTGYSGRIAIHEVFVINDEVRSLIAHSAAILDIREVSYKNGYLPMRYDGIKKVLRGLTTIEEINRVTISDTES